MQMVCVVPVFEFCIANLFSILTASNAVTVKRNRESRRCAIPVNNQRTTAAAGTAVHDIGCFVLQLLVRSFTVVQRKVFTQPVHVYPVLAHHEGLILDFFLSQSRLGHSSENSCHLSEVEPPI